MTAADVLQLRAIELPMLASDPRVRVLADVEVDRLDSCEQCVCRSFRENWAAETEIPVGKFRLTYHFRPGGPEHYTDLCGCACTDVELDEVLNLHSCVGVVLHVPTLRVLPSGPLLSPARTQPSSAVAEDVLSVLHGIRNTARTGEGHDDVETFRRAAIAAVSRIDTERRAA